jgi:hypothetical protein
VVEAENNFNGELAKALLSEMEPAGLDEPHRTVFQTNKSAVTFIMSMARFDDRSPQVELPAASNTEFITNALGNEMNSPMVLNSPEDLLPILGQALFFTESVQSRMENPNPNFDDLIVCLRQGLRHIPMASALVEASMTFFNDNQNADSEAVRQENLDQFEQAMSLRSPIIQRTHLNNIFHRAWKNGDLRAARSCHENLLNLERKLAASREYETGEAIEREQAERVSDLQMMEKFTSGMRDIDLQTLEKFSSGMTEIDLQMLEKFTSGVRRDIELQALEKSTSEMREEEQVLGLGAGEDLGGLEIEPPD